MAKTRKTKEETLLYMVINNCSGSPIQRYLPYVQCGFASKLRELQRVELWNSVYRFVMHVERSHFKLMSQDHDFRQARVLAFYELAIARWNTPPAVVCKEFKSAFSEIEAVLQLRRMGIAFEDAKENKGILAHRTNIIRQFVRYFEWKRSKLPYHIWYVQKYKKEPTELILKNWNKKVQDLEYCLCLSFSPVFGFKPLLSLEEFLETYEDEYRTIHDSEV